MAIYGREDLDILQAVNPGGCKAKQEKPVPRENLAKHWLFLTAPEWIRTTDLPLRRCIRSFSWASWARKHWCFSSVRFIDFMDFTPVSTFCEYTNRNP
jgi:hypothetical protein